MPSLDVEEKLSEGSAVDVFLARSGADRVIVQVSRPELGEDLELYARFLDATKRTQRLRHPGLLCVEHVHCGADGRFVVISQPVAGKTAAAHLNEKGPLSSEVAISWGVSLCEAVQYLHDHQLVHGYLSPHNVFLEGSESSTFVRLLDSALMLFRDVRSLPVPKSRVLVAAPYLAPERVAGQRATPASDVYGLGVMLFELLTGAPPFVADQDPVTRQLHVVAPTPRMPPHLAAWNDIFDRALAKNPSDRFESMVAFRQALLELELRVTHVEAEEDSPVVQGVLLPSPPPLPGPSRAAQATPWPVERFGSWIAQKTIGEGGMGRVLQVIHATLNRKAAVKVLHPQLTARPDQVLRFIQEAQAIGQLDHPNIVKVFDLIQEPGRVAFVMEYLEGISLKVLARERPLELKRAIHLVCDAAEALSAAHRIGVVHRDIKPDNLFVTRGPPESLKVLDFGVARVRGGLVENSRITQVGQVVGTPLWMAPEQVLGRDVDERADLYSLATVLYTLLARRFPFDGAAMGEVVMQRLSSEARPIGEYTFLGEPIPKTLQQLLHVCLAREPERRLSSAKAMVDVLRAALRSLSQDEPVGVPVGAWGSFSTRRSS